MPIKQLLVKLTMESERIRMELSTLDIINGLNTFSWKWPLDPPIVTATLLPITYAATIVKASHYVGLTLPGIIELPGSLAGSDNSPNPLLGPDARNLMSLAIFIQETAIVFKLPWNSTSASWQARASNLFSAVLKGSLVRRAIYLATSSANPLKVFSPVPTAVPPWANLLI